MDQITISLNDTNISKNNRDLMLVSVVSNDTEVQEFYDANITKSNEGCDSGFDLIVTEDVLFTKENHTQLLPLGVKCAPQFNSGYYLYPRSSIFKTPLRMANSVGIIDMTYRGEIMAPVDFHHNLHNEDKYFVKKGTRLFQLCKPTLEPLKFVKVYEHDLSYTTRGTNGFGSTGVGLNL